MNHFENIKTICQCILSYVRKYIEWRKDEFWMNVLKIIFVIVGIGLLAALFKHVIIPLAVIIFFFFIFFEDKIRPECPPAATPYPYEWTAREILYRALISNADVLDIEPPKNIEFITPTRYLVEQPINNLMRYSFIVRHKPDYEDNFREKKELLNTCICQILQNGYPNVPYGFYKGFPLFYVTSIENDFYHSSCFRIDVMPVINDAALSYVQNCDLKDHDIPTDLFSLDDKDF